MVLYAVVVVQTLVFTTLGAGRAHAVGVVPDRVFAACITDKLNLASNTPLTADNLAEVRDLTCYSPMRSIEGAQYLVNATGLFLEGYADGGVGISDLSPLSGLTTLSTLGLPENQIGDLTPLAGLINLTHLDLAGNKLASIEALARLTKLATLDLSRNRLKQLTPLANLTRLTSLNISENEGLGDASVLAKLPALSSLALSCDDASESLSWLTSVTQVKELTFSCSTLAGLPVMPALGSLIVDGLSTFAGSPELPELSLLWIGSGTVRSIDAPLRLPKLTTLWLDGLRLASVQGFASCDLPELNELKILNEPSTTLPVGEGTLTSLAGVQALPKLSTLVTEYNQVEDISALASMRALRVVEFTGGNIVDIEALRSLPDLTSVMLDGNRIRDFTPLRDIDGRWRGLNQNVTIRVKTGAPTVIPLKNSAGQVPAFNNLPSGITLSGDKLVAKTSKTYKVSYDHNWEWCDSNYVCGFSGTLTVIASPTGLGKLTNTPKPKISDSTPKVGQTVAAKPGTWAPGPVNLSYQWYRSGKAIAGATQSTYTVSAGDLAKRLTVRVTGSKAEFASASKTSSETKKVARGTLITTTPAIIGTAAIGQTLTTVPGSWGPEPVTLKYQWYRSGKAIKKATKATYTLVVADKGKAISVKVTGSKSGYSTKSRTSKSTAQVVSGTLQTATPTINGTPAIGSTLTVSAGEWGPSPVTFRYQWYSSEVAIPKANASTYTTSSKDLGKEVTVRVVGSKPGYVTVAKLAVGLTVTA